MYLKFFGLNDRPFSITPNIDYLYMSKQHEQALDTMLYGIHSRMGFSMLSGEVGTGKTLLSRAILSRLGDSCATALLINPLLSVPELLKAITKDFGIAVRYTSPQRQIEALNRFLIHQSENDRNAIVIIDEAQNLSTEALEMIRLLTNLETDSTKLLQILLVGQPELVKKVKRYDMRQLEQRIMTRYHLSPLTQMETMRYINHRLYIAGGGGKVFFEPKAHKILFKASNGYPRLINVICDKALMAAYVKESYVIDDHSVKLAIKDWRGTSKRQPLSFLRRLIFQS